jgi:hypothetical protein
MNRKIKILMLTKTVILLFLVGNFTTTHAADREWQAGDLYTFTHTMHQIFTDHDLEFDVYDQGEVLLQDVFTLNVTEINLLSGLYYAIITDTSGVGSNSAYQFEVDDFVSAYLDNINSFLGVTYEWDYGTNTTKLIGFGLPFFNWFLVDPDWTTLNKAYTDMFNESEIVETVADPYQPIIHNITLGDFLNSISYTIMGQDNLADAKSKMKSDNTEWTMVYDLTNVLNNEVFNGTLGYNEYYPYPNAIFTYEMSYSEGGVLQKALMKMDYSILVDNYQGDVYMKFQFTAGGLEALTGNFAYWMTIPGFLLIVTVARITRRKSNRRNR